MKLMKLPCVHWLLPAPRTFESHVRLSSQKQLCRLSSVCHVFCSTCVSVCGECANHSNRRTGFSGFNTISFHSLMQEVMTTAALRLRGRGMLCHW